ncbi:MAG: aminopeptidase P N-terminal domain-containing protein [Zoogloeaceae bacterium]|jgi:Xaa-Pro aminopeptidase|nr:aminopeptidase P N-terminal domain-containing protein [Zoogloeaceae bacterium]
MTAEPLSPKKAQPKKPCRPQAARRKRLLAHIGEGVAVIPAATEKMRNRDTPYPYRFDSDFWYLTAFPEPDAALVLADGRSILFCREKDAAKEVWEGFRYGPEAAKEVFGFDAAFPFSSLEAQLPQLLADRSALWHSLGQDAESDARIIRALNAVRGMCRTGKRPPARIHDVRQTLDAMRLIKDAAELVLMQEAADIAAAGHLRAMRACRPGKFEHELEAELIYEFRRRGAAGHAYAPIVAGGGNACVLHYVENDKRLPDAGLVLIDAGCEVRGYAADISRTFPVNGRFSAVQKDCYEIVLAAQAAAVAAIRPGAGFDAPHVAAARILTQGMVDLRLLSGTVDGLVESGAYQRFYMHRTGHWLGLDVHDAGDYKQGETWVPLAPGMTLTVEPGLYIRPAADVPEHLHNLGIRIEDDVVVTKRGCRVYTRAPKTVAEIEAAMQSGRAGAT